MQISFGPLVFAVVFCSGLAAQAGHQGIKPGAWGPRHAPPGWIIHETEHYQIQSQVPLDKAKRLGDHMESMLLVYTKLFPTDRSLKQFPLKLFKDQKSFIDYGNDLRLNIGKGTGAWYASGYKEMVCYDTGKWQDDAKHKAAETGPVEDEKAPSRRDRLEELYGMDILGAAAHEGWHQYFHRYVTSWFELPSWINEGMGDYLYCAVPKPTKSRKALAADLGAMNAMRLPVVRYAVKQGEHVPLADLLRYSQEQYYRNPSVCYAQGWALCHFLLHSSNPRYRQVVPTFVKLSRDDTNMETVTNQAFKGIDLNKLEDEWKAWVLEQRLPWEKDPKKAPPKAEGAKTEEPKAGEPKAGEQAPDKKPGEQPAKGEGDKK
jgi:hypothetical protein